MSLVGPRVPFGIRGLLFDLLLTWLRAEADVFGHLTKAPLLKHLACEPIRHRSASVSVKYSRNELALAV